MLFGLKLLQILWLYNEVLQSSSEEFSFDIMMPGVIPKQDNAYLEFVKPTSHDVVYITSFEPKADKNKVHHMILSSCSSAANVFGKLKCFGSISTVYAWARGAPSLALPKGVGFKIGQKTEAPYLQLEVHYAHALEDPDVSGVTLHMTDITQPKQAGVFLLVTSGYIQGNSVENFEVACEMTEDVEMHAFAFRTHTHELGKHVSGYVIKPDGESQEWQLIGEKNPLLPQFFYPVANDGIFIKKNDILAARCTMNNTRPSTVYIGSTSENEMCNFYIMYSVSNDTFPSFDSCFSRGPPQYYWKNDEILKNKLEDNNHMISSNSIDSLIITF